MFLSNRHCLPAIVVAAILAMIALVAPPESLDQVIPFAPFSLALGLFVTVHLVPRCPSAFQILKQLIVQMTIACSLTDDFPRSDAGTVDPNSVHSEPGGYLRRLWDSRPRDGYPLELGHMERPYFMEARLQSIDLDLERGPAGDSDDIDPSLEASLPLLH